jgi:hypothetical protein
MRPQKREQLRGREVLSWEILEGISKCKWSLVSKQGRKGTVGGWIDK